MSDDGGLLGDWLVRYRPGSSISNQEFLLLPFSFWFGLLDMDSSQYLRYWASTDSRELFSIISMDETRNLDSVLEHLHLKVDSVTE